MLRFAIFLCLAVAASAFVTPEFKLIKKIRNHIHGHFSKNTEPKETLDMPHLYSTYNMFGVHDVNSFFTIPRTVEEAKKSGWVEPIETVGNPLFSTYCEENDPTICILCDLKGSIAGYQISISTSVDESKIENMDYVKKGLKKQTLFKKEVYSSQIFFVPQETLKNGGRDFNNQTGVGLWLQTGDTLNEIPLHETKMNTTKFVKQNCFVRMGQHYFWDIRPDLSRADFMPWFLLFDSTGELSGFGFIAFGQQGDPSVNKPWLEHVPTAAIKAIAPGVTDWVIEEGDKHGIISNHVYFKPKPWEIKCSGNEATSYG